MKLERGERWWCPNRKTENREATSPVLRLKQNKLVAEDRKPTGRRQRKARLRLGPVEATALFGELWSDGGRMEMKRKKQNGQKQQGGDDVLNVTACWLTGKTTHDALDTRLLTFCQTIFVR